MKRPLVVALLASAFPLLVVLAACVGSEASTLPAGAADGASPSSAADGGPDADGAGDEDPVDAADAGCVPEPANNLMENGSFARGTDVWDTVGDVVLATPLDGGAGQDCVGSYGIATVRHATDGIIYRLRLPADAGAGRDGGLTVEFGAWLRALDADRTSIELRLDDDQTDEPLALTNIVLEPNAWSSGVKTVGIAAGRPVRFRLTSSTVRTFAVDDAWLVVR